MTLVKWVQYAIIIGVVVRPIIIIIT